MRFSLTLFALGAASVAHAITPASQVVSTIDNLADEIEGLLSPAESLGSSSASQFLSGGGPINDIINGFRDFFDNGINITDNFDDSDGSTYSDDDSEKVLDAIQKLVDNTEKVIDVIIDKAGVLSQLPIIGKPISAALNLIQDFVHIIGDAIVEALPRQEAQEVKNALNGLAKQIDKAIGLYSN